MVAVKNCLACTLYAAAMLLLHNMTVVHLNCMNGNNVGSLILMAGSGTVVNESIHNIRSEGTKVSKVLCEQCAHVSLLQSSAGYILL